MNRDKKRDRGEPRDRMEQRVVEITRVTRVVAGGKRMRFRALVVIGDRRGSVGMAVKKGSDVSEAVNKAANAARKAMIKVPINNGTIPHAVTCKFKASKVLLKPAPAGSGVIAGGPVRAVVEAVGISNIVSKMLGSANKVNNVRAVFAAFGQLKAPRQSGKVQTPQNTQEE